MMSIESIFLEVNSLINNAPKKSFAFFWEDIKGIIEAKVHDYKMSVGQELPDEFFVDIFDSYIEKYKAVNYHKDIETMNKSLSSHLLLFNKGLGQHFNKSVFFLGTEEWNDIFVKQDGSKMDNYMPKLDYNKGCSFIDIYKSYKLVFEAQKEEPYERERMKKSWNFFKSYIFRVIPDNGVIYQDDIKDCLQMLIDYETPKNRFDNEKISSVKQYVSTFNKIFQLRIRLKDVGLSYEQLREKNPKKDGWLRTDEDEEKLKELRRLTHYYLDMLWNNSSEEVKSKMTRAETYAWLSSALVIPRSETHISLFNEEMCVKTILEVFHFLGRS